MNIQGRAAAIMLAAVSLQPLAALADDAKTNRCLEVYQIDHTRVVDDQTILFYLRGGQVLKNTLSFRCVGLRTSTRGFTYVADNDEICGNLQSIKVNDTGEVCELGGFQPYTPAAATN
jgi:hypothetical protein